ncbi:MAG: GH3 auxin-responsive promoter family protein, partial [Bacteroidales bacterium]|nr:GH3 auxin-responsive promoter family protein [Bacteroidales bacterium]
MNLIDFFTNIGIKLLAQQTRIDLLYSSKHPKQSSARTLRRILKENANTVFGKEHHFSKLLWARNADQLFRIYEHAVDPQDYEDL